MLIYSKYHQTDLFNIFVHTYSVFVCLQFYIHLSDGAVQVIKCLVAAGQDIACF